MGAFVWGFVLSTVCLYHGTFTINSLATCGASAPLRPRTTAVTFSFLALITMGEGWHNNHHKFMTPAARACAGGRWTARILGESFGWVGIATKSASRKSFVAQTPEVKAEVEPELAVYESRSGSIRDRVLETSPKRFQLPSAQQTITFAPSLFHRGGGRSAPSQSRTLACIAAICLRNAD